MDIPETKPFQVICACLPVLITLIKTVGMALLFVAVVRFAMETLMSLSLGFFLSCMYIIPMYGNIWVLCLVHFVNIVLFVMSCTSIFNCFTFIVFFMLGMYVIIGYSIAQKPDSEVFTVIYCFLLLVLSGGIIEYVSVTALSWIAVIGGLSTASFAYAAMCRFRLKSLIFEQDMKMIAAAKLAAEEAELAAEYARETKKKIRYFSWFRKEPESNMKEQDAQTMEIPKPPTRNFATQTPYGGLGYNTFAGGQLPPRFQAHRLASSTPKSSHRRRN